MSRRKGEIIKYLKWDANLSLTVTLLFLNHMEAVRINFFKPPSQIEC